MNFLEDKWLKLDKGEITLVRIRVHVITFRCQVHLVAADSNFFFCCSDIYTLVSVWYLILLMWTFLQGGHTSSVLSDFAFPYEIAGFAVEVIPLETFSWSAFSGSHRSPSMT